MSLGSDRDWMYERRLREQQPQQTHFSGQDAIRKLNDAIKPIQEDPNRNPKTYCMDFDGVLHYHEAGSGAGSLGEPLEPGVKLAKRIKAAGHKLVILTARPKDQHHTIQGWLKGHGVRADEVTSVKPPAEMYIDDRAEHWPRNAGHEESEPPPSGQGPSIDIARKASNREGGPGSGPKSRLELQRVARQRAEAIRNARFRKVKTGGPGSGPRGRDYVAEKYGKTYSRSEPKGKVKFLGRDPEEEEPETSDEEWKPTSNPFLSGEYEPKESRESRINHFGENSGDGAMNMLDGHHYRSLATREGGPGSGPKKHPKFMNPTNESFSALHKFEAGKLTLLKTTTIDPSKLYSQEAAWGGDFDKDKARRYAEQWRKGSEPPPVPITKAGGRWVILDGQHRAHAAALLGRKLPVKIYGERRKN